MNSMQESANKLKKCANVVSCVLCKLHWVIDERPYTVIVL